METVDFKTPSQSLVIMNELVLPNDTNYFGNLMGGRLMYWMDVASGIASGKHTNLPGMTVSVDNLSFKYPIKLGNNVHLEAKATRAFNTSLEIHIKVWGEDLLQQTKYLSNEAYFTFVALDEHRRPKKIPAIQPETDEEIEQYNGALRRRQLRLLQAGKLNIEDAKELLELFKTK
ncbi:acyl-CoA thioesterase [Rhizosphaericola mali]|uniref:Acyl-CoA thioesterase n=1 Tax=Rhizosphaericola mali TaxID=2545455 RepID=A0A5P2FYE1_9BACT|nr:acyl-CoA thioesterase [Rhizosphaericola mali]QES88195.1 acyl-CoA thioesterase [Rhizosphaericola mali]